MAGSLVLLSAIPCALLVYIAHEAFPERPERAILIIGGAFLVLFALPLLVYLFFARWSANPWKMAVIALSTISAFLISIYLYSVSHIVSFPGDFLIWSESQFVNDILKFRIGYPLYTDGNNHESFIYPPAAQLTTYLLAWAIGHPMSIVVYRMIQVAFVILTTVVAALCCQRIVKLHHSNSLGHRRWSMGVLWLPVLFLMATNSITNPFIHFLHNDSLALVITVSAYYLLLKYMHTRELRTLAGMAMIPAVGFLVKQNLVIWSALYFVYLAIFDQPRSMKRVVGFVGISMSVLAGVLISCYILWGGDFFYWTFTVLGARAKQVSVLRSVGHIVDAWPYFAIGLLGGGILAGQINIRSLLGPWMIWLLLILNEAYSGGIGWTRSHLGPGSLIAGIWFLAALSIHWPEDRYAMGKFSGQAWLRASVAVGVGILVFSGLGVVRIPAKPFPVEDAYRYVREIEKQFEGQSASDILLDVGTWVYIKERVIMKDSAIPIGDQGFSETSDFLGIRQRLEEKRYAKILVRNLHARDFWYDYSFWRKSSGIKQTLLDNYQEVGGINEVVDRDGKGTKMYTFGRISILVPRPK